MTSTEEFRLIEQFVATYSEAPNITLDIDHADRCARPAGAYLLQSSLGHYCYLPLLVFGVESGALVTSACCAKVKRPTGVENAMIMKRVLHVLRQHWPHTHILLLRGGGHFSNPELMKNARGHLALYQLMAAQGIGPVVSSVRLFGEFDYAARWSWPQAHRVVLKAEVLAGNNGLPAKDSHPFAVQDCRTCKQYKDRVLLHLPSACPVKALLEKSVNDSFQPAGNLPCWPLHNPARPAQETLPPSSFPITSSRSTLAVGVGEISPENQKNRGAATKMWDRKFMQSSG